MTTEKFSKHRFSSFHLILPFSFESRLRWHFGFLIYKNMYLSLNIYLDLMSEKFLSHEEELVLKKNPSVESILSQFLIHFQFSCVNLTNQIFMSFLFHTNYEDHGHDLVENLRLASPRQINRLTLLIFQRHFSAIWQP